MTEYDIDLTVLHAHQELIDLKALERTIDHPWWNRTLTQVNNSVVRVGCFQGEFHWHKHDDDDEFFLCLSGKFIIDLEDKTIELGPMQGVTIGKGVLHRPRADEKTMVLMVETSDIVPTGD